MVSKERVIDGLLIVFILAIWWSLYGCAGKAQMRKAQCDLCRAAGKLEILQLQMEGNTHGQ